MWLRRQPGEHGRSAGFVLVEVLVTAAVAAVLLAALMRAFSSTWSGIGAVREETDAMLVARAVIEASTPRNNLAPLTQEGVIGRYAWTVAIANTGIQSSIASQQQQQQPGSGQSSLGQGRSGSSATGREDENQPQSRTGPTGDREEGETQELPWTLFRIAVAVRAPSGRRTIVETFRLSRPAAR